MSGEDIQVQPADLRAHAGSVDAVADGLETAKQAGDVVRMGAGAYGQLCTIVPVLLNGLQALLIDGIDAAADSVHDTAGRLRATADAYQATDEQAAAALDRIRGAG